MPRTNPVTIEGVDYASKTSAIMAWHALGATHSKIAEKVGVGVGYVGSVISQQKRKAQRASGDPAQAENCWTPEKRDKARKLFGKTMIYIAEALNVPPREFLTYVLNGVIPPSQKIADPDDIRWREGGVVAPELVALPPVEPPPAHAFEPVEGEDAIDADWTEVSGVSVADVADEQDRAEDEAELAAMAAAEAEEEGGDDEAPAPGAIAPTSPPRGEVKEVPAAPVSRFQDPPPAAPAGKATGVAAPGQVMCLMDEMGRYLHESLDGMTTNPRFAWKGGADKVKIVQGRLPHLRQLDVVAYTR